ncbi:MAG TPA: hypothetical protein ENN40_06010 [Candidatus Aminicenantes bacterium]|nr:hypothetical protein [Candidatus Aminicenantes bacterium]
MVAWLICLVNHVPAVEDCPLIVKAAVPESVLSGRVLSNVEAACRYLAMNQAAEAAAALHRAAGEMPVSSLAADLKTAAHLLESDSSVTVVNPGANVTGTNPFFVLLLGNEHSSTRAFLCLPLPPGEVWLTPYLEEPARLRPDLPEKLPGVSADMAALPAVRLVDLVAASHAESLSAWIPCRDGSGMVAVFRNLVVAYGRDHLKKSAAGVLSAAWSRHVDVKALEWLVAMHRVAHGLGTVAVENDTGEGMVSVASQLGENAHLLETIKADGLAFLAGLRLAGTLSGFGISTQKITATYVMFLLDRALHGRGGQMKALRALLSQLIADGGIRLDLKSCRLILDSRRMQVSIKKMVQQVVRIQGNGSVKEAEGLLAAGATQAGKHDLLVAMMPRGMAGFRLVAQVTDTDEKK